MIPLFLCAMLLHAQMSLMFSLTNFIHFIHFIMYHFISYYYMKNQAYMYFGGVFTCTTCEPQSIPNNTIWAHRYN
jgi:hypothetical protein